MESPISHREVEEAIDSLEEERSPSTDRFTVEFYRKF